MEYRIIDRAHAQDLHLKNEPFPLFGRMIPSCTDGVWSHREEPLPPEEVTEMCFPEEAYDFDALSKDHTFIGAYDGDACVGLAVYADAWYGYYYLEDLKVCGSYRGHGVGRGLIREGLKLALNRHYRGIYTIGQDNNLAACRFYLANGFEIGGFDNRVYHGTPQEGKADIYFYLDEPDR